MAEDIDFVEIEKPDFDVVGDTVFFINLTKGMTEGPLFKAEVPTSAKVVDGITEEALELADMGDEGEKGREFISELCSIYSLLLPHISLPPYVGSMFLLRRLNVTRSCASSPDNSLSDKSFLMLSNHLRFGLPLLLFPGISITITLLPMYSSSLLNACP